MKPKSRQNLEEFPAESKSKSRQNDAQISLWIEVHSVQMKFKSWIGRIFHQIEVQIPLLWV